MKMPKGIWIIFLSLCCLAKGQAAEISINDVIASGEPLLMVGGNTYTYQFSSIVNGATSQDFISVNPNAVSFVSGAFISGHSGFEGGLDASSDSWIIEMFQAPAPVGTKYIYPFESITNNYGSSGPRQHGFTAGVYAGGINIGVGNTDLGGRLKITMRWGSAYLGFLEVNGALSNQLYRQQFVFPRPTAWPGLTAGFTNHALGKPVTVSSSYNDGIYFGGSKLVDGSISEIRPDPATPGVQESGNYWLPKGSLSTDEGSWPWAVIDLGKLETIQTVSILNTLNASYKDRGALDFQISTSTDGQTYTGTLIWASLAWQNKTFQNFSFEQPVAARFVKIRISQAWGLSKAAGLNEIQLWGPVSTSSSNNPPPAGGGTNSAPSDWTVLASEDFALRGQAVGERIHGRTPTVSGTRFNSSWMENWIYGPQEYWLLAQEGQETFLKPSPQHTDVSLSLASSLQAGLTYRVSADLRVLSSGVIGLVFYKNPAVTEWQSSSTELYMNVGSNGIGVYQGGGSGNQLLQQNFSAINFGAGSKKLTLEWNTQNKAVAAYLDGALLWQGTANLADPAKVTAVGFFKNHGTFQNGSKLDNFVFERNSSPLRLILSFNQARGQVNLTPRGGGAGGNEFWANTPVNLTAQPYPGFRFSGWSGGASSSSPSLTMTISSETSVDAVFEPDTSDSDLDGLNNYQEIVQYNTDPNVPNLTSPVAGLYTLNQMEAAQAQARAEITSQPNAHGLFTTNQIHEMSIGKLVLHRTNGELRLGYQIEQSPDLTNWTTYLTNEVVITNSPPEKVFLRIQAK